MRKASQASFESVENSHNLNSKEIIEVKERQVKVSVTVDSGPAGHVMLFHVSNSSAKHHQRGLGEKNVPFKTNERIQRCITFRGASVVKTSHFNAESCPSQ